MATAGLGAPVVARSRANTPAPQVHVSGTGGSAIAAWLCLVPCTIALLAAARALAPALGPLLSSRGSLTFLSLYGTDVHPEGPEEGRYLIALAGPPLLTLATIAVARGRAARLGASRLAALVALASQALLVAFVAWCFVTQYRLVYGPGYWRGLGSFGMRYFRAPTLAAAAVTAAVLWLAARRPAIRRHAATRIRETRGRQIAAGTVAVLATVVWMLQAVNTDSSISTAPFGQLYHLGFQQDETFAVVNGLTPLVSFTAQYSSLWPFAFALPLLAFGKTLLVLTLATTAVTSIALLCGYGILRRATRNSSAAVLLFLPFLATSLFMYAGNLVHRVSPATYLPTFPLRYAGPYLLAWVLARRLDRAPTVRNWPLFALSGLVAINNVDFGVPALGAAIVALLCTSPRLDRRTLARLAGDIALGLLAAVGCVCMLTLLRAGSLPQPWRLVQFARIYASGFAGMPMPPLGLHLVIYATFVGAIATAATRALDGEPNRVLTGMLAWVGVFGLGAAAYYVGRSHPQALVSLFSAWALALSLLAFVVLTRRPEPLRRLNPASIAVLFGLGLSASSLAQLPTPWSQLARIDSGTRQPFVAPTNARFFVASIADGPHRFVYRRGAPVALLLTNGHRLADAYGVRDVTPVSGGESIVTVQQLDDVIHALRAAGGNTIVIPTNSYLDPEIGIILGRRGFRIATSSGLEDAGYGLTTSDALALGWDTGYIDAGELVKWVDARHLHPAALGYH